MESQKNKVVSLEQMLENNKQQLSKTNADLDEALRRANQVVLYLFLNDN